MCKGSRSADRKGTPNKTFSAFADSEPGASTRHSHFQTSHLAFHLWERGVLLELCAPTPGSCGLKVEARFVQLRGPEPLLRRRLPPPRPALVEVVVSLPFFSSLSPHVFPPQQECSPYSWGCG